MALGPTQRVFSAAKRLLRSLLANGETRLRLAVLELEEERARLLVLLLLAGASLLLLLLGVATLTALVVVLFWDFTSLLLGPDASVTSRKLLES